MNVGYLKKNSDQSSEGGCCDHIECYLTYQIAITAMGAVHLSALMRKHIYIYNKEEDRIMGIL